MSTEKLTLRLDGELIDRAKRAARERGTSVSKMVAGFFEAIEDPAPAQHDDGYGEITRRLKGSIKPTGDRSVDEKDYRRYLEHKHGS